MFGNRFFQEGFKNLGDTKFKVLQCVYYKFDFGHFPKENGQFQENITKDKKTQLKIPVFIPENVNVNLWFYLVKKIFLRNSYLK